MAFHFNWSPLIADTDRVRQMLTSSLNKSPKPPIIVDDIVVNELNLGSNPPSLEILEVGDLAEDRFRGIFKVRYEGDAYLTLKTKVQANPLNTFLSTKPTFASPRPLAAGSGLTIPLQITLSDIRLSGFVILVFSKQKGITLVFRNDPLESLKVSSTFDSIPFVREYLQKTIEGQLRVLFMEDLPAIIHRLSLRVFTPEFQDTSDNEESAKKVFEEQKPVDPFASPAQKAGDGEEAAVDSLFSLDGQGETYASFSQKNLLRLAALTESQRTLSLFTPSIRDTVYRAWASTADHHAPGGSPPTGIQQPATLSRIQSSLNTATGASPYASSHASDAPSHRTHASRPSISSHASAPTVYTLGSGRPRPHATKKRKHRVVNLRRNKEGSGDGLSDTVSVSSGYEDSASRSESRSAGDGSTSLNSPEMSTIPTSAPSGSFHSNIEREGELQTPPRSPVKRKAGSLRSRLATPDAVVVPETSATTLPMRARPVTPRQPILVEDNDPTPRASMYLYKEPVSYASDQKQQAAGERQEQPPPTMRRIPSRSQTGSGKAPAPRSPPLQRSASELSISDLVSAFPSQSGSNGGILEQAWMMKMANEIAKRVTEEKTKQGAWPQAHGGAQDEGPPPAYVS